MEPVSSRLPSAGEAAARCVLVLAIAVLAPLLSIRQGLHALRAAHRRRRWPQASPIYEVTAGVAAAMAVASVSGVAAYALAGFPQWRLGFLRAPWVGASVLVPIVLCAAALYAVDIPDWRRRMDGTVTYGGLLKWGIGFIAVSLLIDPSRWLRGSEDWIVRAGGSSWWWLGQRWREVLVGVPCLSIGLMKYLQRVWELEKSHDGKALTDPRPWLLAGLLSPIGILHSFGTALAPLDGLVVQTLTVCLIGSILGFMAMGLFAFSRPAGPPGDRK